MILKSGFYISKGTPWSDWHSGHKFEGTSYVFLLLRKDKKFIKKSKNDKKFDFLSFLKSKNDKKLLNDTSTTFGDYDVEDNILKLIYESWEEKRSLNYTILSPNVLLDEKLKEYHFKYVVAIEYEEKWLKAAINKGDDIWVASNPLELNLLFKNLDLVPVNSINNPQDLAVFFKNLDNLDILREITSFGNEMKLLSENGYIYNQTSKMFIK